MRRSVTTDTQLTQPFARSTRTPLHKLLDSKHTPSRRALIATGLVTVALAAVAGAPGLLGPQVSKAITDLGTAQPLWLWVAGAFFALALVSGAWAWRGAVALCGGETDRVDSVARFCTGSLVNSFAPAKLGEAVRLALFSRRIEGDDKLWKVGGVFGVVAAARAVAQGLLVVIAFASGALPLWPVFVFAGVVLLAAGVALASRGRRANSHVAHVLDAFRALGSCPKQAAGIVGWCTVSMGARVGAATAIAAAMGIPSPLIAALIIVPALDIAGTIPLTPGNIGITSGAIAIALESRGVDLTTALSAGIALHAVETAASVVLGSLGALLLTRFPSVRTRRLSLVAAGAGTSLALVAAFGATVLVDFF
jgi:uncharacterized membrane protein YbhN (UPF0104 family)